MTETVPGTQGTGRPFRQAAIYGDTETLAVPCPYLLTAPQLLAHPRVREIVADEGRAHRAPNFLDGLVGGVLGAALGETAQDLLGLRGAQAERGGVFVVYLTIWSYCWAIRSQSIVRVESTEARAGQLADGPSSSGSVAPSRFEHSMTVGLWPGGAQFSFPPYSLWAFGCGPGIARIPFSALDGLINPDVVQLATSSS